MFRMAHSRGSGGGFGILGWSLMGTLVACGPERSSGIQTQLTDSAGVTIVESSGFPESGARGWVLGQASTLSIGTLEGDSLYQFYGVSAGVKLSDGRIAVSDVGSHQLRIFAPDGTFLTAFGREGEGPGEFRNIRVMGIVGFDTLVILDGRQRRVSRYHPEAGFLGQTLLPDEAGVAMHSNGMFEDGAIVFGGGVNRVRGGEAPEPGYERLTNSFFSVTLDGAGITHFGDFPGTEVFWTTTEYDGEEMTAAAFLHFGKSPEAMAGGERLALGTRDRYEVEVFDPSGSLVRVVRVLTPPVAVTPTHLDGLLKERLARLQDPDIAPGIRSAFRDTPSADHLPAFERLFLDSEGYLWVEDYHLPGQEVRTWTIFDADGRPLTRLSLPAGNQVLQIGQDYVLARFRDELDVDFVRIYPLTRGG